MMTTCKLIRLSLNTLRTTPTKNYIHQYSSLMGSSNHFNILKSKPKININLLGKSSIRTCSQMHNSSKENESGQVIVYTGTLSRQIRFVKFFSLTTSVMGVCIQPVIYQHLSELQSVPILIAGLGFAGFFTFVTPFLLHFITKKYVINLSYNPTKESYTATTLNIFCKPKQVEFKPEDVHVPDVPGLFTTFHAKGKPLFLEAQLFDNPAHYAKIMGYDKPMDFKLYQTHIEETKKKD